MTYQIILTGRDGILIASDKRERAPQAGESEQNPALASRFPNFVEKIKTSPDGKYAWAFSGGRRAKFLSEYVYNSVGDHVNSDSDLETIVQGCLGTADKHWYDTRTGNEGDTGDSVIFACGQSQKVVRYRHDSVRWSRDNVSPCCIAGLEWNHSSFVIARFYNQCAPVDDLALLASYAIRSAHELDTYAIDKLDLYICRVGGTFERGNADGYWRKAQEIDIDIRYLFRAK